MAAAKSNGGIDLPDGAAGIHGKSRENCKSLLKKQTWRTTKYFLTLAATVSALLYGRKPTP
jgi:hypothetical protein